MQQNVKISHSAVRGYFSADFARGCDFSPTFTGAQLVDTERVNGLLVNTGDDGSPELRDEFLDHMEENDSDFRAPYERMVAIFNAMRPEIVATPAEEKMDHLHQALGWFAFDRLQGVTQEQYAERRGVHERTVRRWLAQAIKHVVRELKGETGPATIIVFPSSYQPAAARG